LGDGTLKSFLYRGEDMESQICDVIATCDYVKSKVRSKKTMMLSFDEWNVWDYTASAAAKFERWSEAPDQLNQIYTLADALVVASMLHSLLRHCDRVRAACLAQLVNVIAPIRAEAGGPAWRQTIFHPFALIARHARGGRVVTHFSTSPTESVPEVLHGEPMSILDSVAVLHDATGILTVFALNRSATEALPLTLNAPGAAAWKLLDHTELSHADPLARNSVAEANNVAPKPALAQAKLNDDSWHALLPPASWHVLRFQA
jgi:alpha-N-arabinofuranosidase